jgi:hypothetical protein
MCRRSGTTRLRALTEICWINDGMPGVGLSIYC